MMQITSVPIRMLRKSTYGRTQLFLPSKGCILREVKCMGGVLRRNNASIFHVCPTEFSDEVVCWHCCEVFSSESIPIPRFFDSQEKMYHVYGRTCSPNCCKAYIIEHTSFDRAQQLNVFTHMLREIYGITHNIVEAPPRISLTRFGGMMKRDPRHMVRAKIVEPPFVSYCMLVEELSMGQEDVVSFMPVKEEADTFEEPQPPSMFEEFIKDRQPPAKRSRTTVGSSKSLPEGPMKKFVK